MSKFQQNCSTLARPVHAATGATLAAYELGRSLNELSWSVQVAYLGSCDVARARVVRLLEELSTLVRRAVPDDAREDLGSAFLDASRSFEECFRTDNRSEQLWQAAEEVERWSAGGGESLRESREAECRLLLLAVGGFAPGLRLRSVGAMDAAAAKALELGETVDQALRPAPAYRFLYDPLQPVGQPPGIFCNHVPAAGSLDLPPTWHALVEERWAEWQAAAGNALPGVIVRPRWLTLTPDQLILKVDAAVRRALAVTVEPALATGQSRNTESPWHGVPAEGTADWMDNYVQFGDVLLVVDVPRATLSTACSTDKIKSVQRGRSRFVHAADFMRWKLEQERKREAAGGVAPSAAVHDEFRSRKIAKKS
jgi:hypothetical protein